MARDLANGLLEKDPERRLSVEAALAHPFFAPPSQPAAPPLLAAVEETATIPASPLRRIVVSDADIQAAIDPMRSMPNVTGSAAAAQTGAGRPTAKADRGSPDATASAGASTLQSHDRDAGSMFRAATAPHGLRSHTPLLFEGRSPDRLGGAQSAVTTPSPRSSRSWGRFNGQGEDAGGMAAVTECAGIDDAGSADASEAGIAAPKFSDAFVGVGGGVDTTSGSLNLSPSASRAPSVSGTVIGVIFSGDRLRGSIDCRGRDVDAALRSFERDQDAGEAAQAAQEASQPATFTGIGAAT